MMGCSDGAGIVASVFVAGAGELGVAAGADDVVGGGAVEVAEADGPTGEGAAGDGVPAAAGKVVTGGDAGGGTSATAVGAVGGGDVDACGEVAGGPAVAGAAITPALLAAAGIAGTAVSVCDTAIHAIAARMPMKSAVPSQSPRVILVGLPP